MRQRKKRPTSPKVFRFLCELAYIFIIRTKNLSSNPSKSRPMQCLVQRAHSIRKGRIFHGIHETEALLTFRDRDLEVPTFKKCTSGPIKVVSAKTKLAHNVNYSTLTKIIIIKPDALPL